MEGGGGGGRQKEKKEVLIEVSMVGFERFPRGALYFGFREHLLKHLTILRNTMRRRHKRKREEKVVGKGRRGGSS